MSKNISILGVTGSIGDATLRIYESFKSELNVIAVSANKNIEKLFKIIDICHPKYAVILDEAEYNKHFGTNEAKYNNTEILLGKEALDFICSIKENDIILNAISGKAGLAPSVTILQNGIDIALANKESLVCAGEILKNIAQKNNAKIIPVDSEHSAIFHLLAKENTKNVENIYITASGGPFLNLKKSEWSKITISDALNHPTWRMGNKISIDSATMANKGLEVIEAHVLFDIDYDKIKVLVHPQSIIHSMIETKDGEIYAQIGPNDMSIPVQNAIFNQNMHKNTYNRFDFSKNINLELKPIDLDKFTMLKLAYQCGRAGGLWTAFFNDVNEILVYLFLSHEIKFTQIESIMAKALECFYKTSDFDKNNVSLETIALTGEKANQIVNKILCENN